MSAREAYVWMKDIDHEAMAAFFAAYGDIGVFPAAPDILRIVVAESNDESDFHRLRELALQEFIQDFTVFILPGSPGYPIEAVLRELPKLGPGVFGAAELATEAVLRNLAALKAALRKYYYDLLGTETVDTVVGFIRADQNASQASQRLFMHRNTLNYRLDHFTDKTEIDVRSFTGGLAAYLLFRA